MASYTVYNGVKKLQTFLNTVASSLGFAKLKVDGELGPKTAAALQAWLGATPACATSQTSADCMNALQTAAGLTAADLLEVQAAASTFATQTGGVAVAKTEEGGIPTWGWFLIGLGVLTAGYFGYKYLVKPHKAMGEMGEFGSDCGCGG